MEILMSLTFPNLLKLLVKIACLIKISGWNNLLLLIRFMTLDLFLMTVSMLILMIKLFQVTVILSTLFKVLLKVIMRVGSTVLCISIMLSFPVLCSFEVPSVCLPMLVDFCFNNLFSHDTPMHRKWVRLKCVGYLLLDALFHFIYIYPM